MKSLFSIVLLMGLLITSSAQEEVVQKEIKVNGACDMCKKRIEKALNIDEVKYAKWNKETKRLKIAFTNTITSDSLEHIIANAGHDTENFQTPDSVYANLPRCCKYRDNVKTH